MIKQDLMNLQNLRHNPMTFRPELLDELLQGYENPEDLLGNEGILKQLTAALVELCLNAEMKLRLKQNSSE